MRIAVLEHFTSLPGGARRTDRTGMGRAMRDAAVADLMRLPDVEVDVVQRQAAFPAALRSADAALVIAPEENGVLARLCHAVERRGCLLLGPSSSAVRLAADKLALTRCLLAAGVATPWTESVPFALARRRLRAVSPPFVLKPRNGCGGRGVIVVRRASDIEAALGAVRRATRRLDCLVQEWVEGQPASVSLIASDGLLDLGLNLQKLLRRRRGTTYLGGETCWPHPRAGAAVAAARAAVDSLGRARPGVRGYLGVDVILGRRGATVIEINPRLTSSYLGLRRSIRENLASLILDAAAGHAVPDHITWEGRCRFRADGVFTMLTAAPFRGRVTAAGRMAGDGVGRWRTISAGTSAAST